MYFYIAAFGLFVSWLIPLHFLPWVSWHLEVVAFCTVLFLSWGAILRSFSAGGERTVGFPALSLPFMGLAMVAFCQFTMGLSTFGGDVVVFVFYMDLCIACLALGFGSARVGGGRAEVTERDKADSAVTVMATVVLLASFVSAVVAFAQVFDLSHDAWINQMPGRRPGGNLGQPNHLATLLLMGVASILFLYESRRLDDVSSASLFLVLIAALAMSESRTGALSFLLLSGWWILKNKRANFRLSPWAVALAGAGFLILFWTWPSIFAFIQLSSGLDAEVNTKAGTRLVVWPQLLQAVLEKPWWGWGLGEVPKAHNAVVHLYAVSEPFSYSHNILLDLALGMGVPLAALLVLAAGIWLLRRIRTANHLLAWYCLALALPFGVHSMLEFPFAYAYFLVPVMFLLGVMEGMAGHTPVLRIGPRTAATLLLVVSILGAWAVAEYVAIEEDFRIARFEALSVGQTPAEYQRPKVVLLTQLGALLDGARISPKPGMAAEELALAKKAALRYPWTATQNRYALSLALNGEPEEAVRQLRVMRAMHGEKAYGQIRENWAGLAQDKYPQLRELKLP